MVAISFDADINQTDKVYFKDKIRCADFIHSFFGASHLDSSTAHLNFLKVEHFYNLLTYTFVYFDRYANLNPYFNPDILLSNLTHTIFRPLKKNWYFR